MTLANELLKEHSDTVACSFEPYVLPDCGIYSLKGSEAYAYLTEPSLFSFKLNRERGKGFLYGLDHVKVRQSLLNRLDQEERVSIFKRKCDYFGLYDLFQGRLQDVRDVLDIGMGHSVYLIETEAGSWVLKQHEKSNQVVYCDILTRLGWPSYQMMYETNVASGWELADYLGGQSLQQCLHAHGMSPHLHTQLAQHAALGDVLGHGDRHFENYVVKDDVLYPVDVFFLFWPDNEVWIERYIAGGMSEINALYAYHNDPKTLNDHAALFFSTYVSTIHDIASQQSTILECIGSYYDEPGEKISYLQTRLTDIDGYVATQKERYQRSFIEACHRQYYKGLLQGLIEKDPHCLDEHPLLRMYYLADKERLSCFFLLDYYHRRALFKKIDELASLMLGVTSDSISLIQERSEAIHFL